jgi:hypothetical protein
MDDVALKPCPLCGSTPWPGTSSWGTTTAACSSQNCALVGVEVPADEWNARPIEDALRADVVAAEARGRAAERAEIVADLKARADQRYQQAEACKRDGGNWEMVAAKATEVEACRDIVRRRTKIEAAPEPSTETPA